MLDKKKGIQAILGGVLAAVVNIQSQLSDIIDLSFHVLGHLHANLSLMNDEDFFSKHLCLPETIMGQLSLEQRDMLEQVLMSIGMVKGHNSKGRR
jgi:hypothetical protein